MIFQAHVADVYIRGCSSWIRRSTHSPLLPLDGPSHNLSQSKIKICWKTEKTQFTAQAHANPQNTFCVFRLPQKSEKYKYLDIQNISLTQVPQLKSPCCTIQTSWSQHHWFDPPNVCVMQLLEKIKEGKLFGSTMTSACALGYLIVYLKTCPCEIGCLVGALLPSHNSPGLLGTIGSRHVSRADRLHVDRTYNWPSLSWFVRSFGWLYADPLYVDRTYNWPSLHRSYVRSYADHPFVFALITYLRATITTRRRKSRSWPLVTWLSHTIDRLICRGQTEHLQSPIYMDGPQFLIIFANI